MGKGQILDQFNLRYFDVEKREYKTKLEKRILFMFTEDDLLKRKLDFDCLYEPNKIFYLVEHKDMDNNAVSYIYREDDLKNPILEYYGGCPKKWLDQENLIKLYIE